MPHPSSPSVDTLPRPGDRHAASSPGRVLTVVGVSGSPTTPSKTSVLVGEVAGAFAAGLGGRASLLELAPLLPELAAGPSRTDLGKNARLALEEVEAADLIVVGSPAYRATYTGLFKLFFDHIGQYALVDKPVVLTATGGSDRHALLVEHQMRPLFGFFQALTLPLGIFAQSSDLEGYRLSSADLRHRIDVSVRRTLPLISSQLGGDTGGRSRDFARPDAF
ncbi:MAG: NADH-dependent reductase [Naasia sp.]|jgi:FMN reductase|uniref:FMN reductase n=1 Tax=Naasia sp. TaxID=2546198 RepID=UPI0026067234|nr:FMN reductase [Naasia sp.]MCU1569928.1 NADH-dependent reductase [Naasia sp.]